MNNTQNALCNPMQYQNHLRFPRDLERAYRDDYASRAIKMHRLFIAFGFVLYGLFGILDYYAMQGTHEVAWAALRDRTAQHSCLSHRGTWRFTGADLESGKHRRSTP